MKIIKEIVIFPFLVLIIINLLYYIIYYIKGINLANEIYRLENEIKKLDLENKKIEVNIAKTENLDFISSKAAELGLKYPLKYWYWQPNQYAFQYIR